jgi:hypothetical protein
LKERTFLKKVCFTSGLKSGVINREIKLKEIGTDGGYLKISGIERGTF